MFEFEDSKLGPVKIINVTEARSNIAAIMMDKEFNYIITKNNKPIRVIINYEAYRKVNTPKIASRQVQTPLKEENTLVKGLIEKREKDLKGSFEKTPESISSEEAFNEELESMELSHESSLNESLNDIVVNNVHENESFEDKITNDINDDHKNVHEKDVIEEPLVDSRLSEHLPDPENAYFKKYEKLYSKKIEKETPPNDSITQNIKDNSIDVHKNIQNNDLEKSSFPGVPVKPKTKTLPSIQEILRELENEKLFGEKN